MHSSGYSPMPRQGPLRVFYLQAEIQYHYLRERLQQLRLDPAILAKARDTLVVTPKLRLLLDEQGVAQVVRQEIGRKLDAERLRKHDVILGVLLDEATEGRLYSIMQLSEKFENTLGLGSKHTIRERLSVLATKGFVKFRRDGSEFGLEVVRSRFGYLCVEGMTFGPDVETVDPETGEVTTSARRVLPSHFKCPQSGNCLDVENPEIWVYPQGVFDDLTPPENDLTPEELGLTPHSSRKIKS